MRISRRLRAAGAICPTRPRTRARAHGAVHVFLARARDRLELLTVGRVQHGNGVTGGGGHPLIGDEVLWLTMCAVKWRPDGQLLKWLAAAPPSLPGVSGGAETRPASIAQAL